MIKRHELYYTNDLGDDYPAFSKDAEDGEWVAYADHAAFVERVREIAEGMEHAWDCQVVWCAYVKRDGTKCCHDQDHHDERHLFRPGPCTCPRGKLLALCEAK